MKIQDNTSWYTKRISPLFLTPYEEAVILTQFNIFIWVYSAMPSALKSQASYTEGEMRGDA